MIRRHCPVSLVTRLLLVIGCFLITHHSLVITARAQSATATLSGTVEDERGAVIPGAAVTVLNPNTALQRQTVTNEQGSFTVTLLQPGTYTLTVLRDGFAPIEVKNVVLNVGDQKSLQIQLKAGNINEAVTIQSDVPLLDTQSAAVSTVVDRNFAENLPMNGRSFQALIQLTPGVVLTPNNGNDTGQFSVNGQRATSNYWMVDGVGANIGVSASATPGNGLGGALGSYSALGGTNSLVSVDAMQEFRIQTSTYAPEFGRTPGAQISIVTRSGTNLFHGAAFDYLRNDVFDANDWFANSAGLPKPKERQNDFGGTFSGPVLLPRFGEGGRQPGYSGRNRTFFFFSYEGLRLRLPQTLLTNVPDLSARQNATPAMKPLLNAYPLPTPGAPDNLTTGIAQFNSSFSNPATLDAYSLRIDHKLSDKLSLFSRYNYSPSEIDQRGASGTSLSVVQPVKIITQTGTAGLTWSILPTIANDFRFNYSSTDSSSTYHQDNFGGAVPFATLPFPSSSLTAENAAFAFLIFSLGSSNFVVAAGRNAGTRQQQINIVDSVSVQKGPHSLKFGVDFRRMSPEIKPRTYFQEPIFLDVPNAVKGNQFLTALNSNRDTTLLFRDLAMFAQDTWRIGARLTLTYGLRWDVDFVPSTISGPSLNAVTGFNLSNLSNLALAPAGTPPYKTTYRNFAPRIGMAYQLSQNQRWQTVLRGGFGVFYDLATSEVGNVTALTDYPFGIFSPIFGGTYPLTAVQVAPPPITPPTASNGLLFGFDPTLQLPYTLQWNVAMEQALGRQQTITASYIGASGRRLLQTADITSPNSHLARAELITNAATSNYNALQFQFQRRLSHNLQALVSYTWSHSIDTASAGSVLGSSSNGLVAGLNPELNRGPSDFDIRNAFSAALTYDVPAPKSNAFARAILRGWSTENIIQARSAPPVNVFYGSFSLLSNFTTQVRPNVSGQPLYLSGSQYPGGIALNPAAFTTPPLGANLPTGQGSLSRNALRGFGATQWDFAIHRDFPIRESVKLQFRAEMFNVLNHPNFGPPVGNLGSPSALNPQFGKSTQMLGRSLSGQTGFGGFNPLYQIGGPRSIQLALKVTF